MKGNKGKKKAILGFLLHLPVLGVGVYTYFTILSSFQESSHFGNMSQFDSSVNNIMTLAILAWPLAIVGKVLLALSLFQHKYRAQWFFWALCALAGVNLISFSLETFIAIALVIFLVLKRAEFGVVSDDHQAESSSSEAP